MDQRIGRLELRCAVGGCSTPCEAAVHKNAVRLARGGLLQPVQRRTVHSAKPALLACQQEIWVVAIEDHLQGARYGCGTQFTDECVA